MDTGFSQRRLCALCRKATVDPRGVNSVPSSKEEGLRKRKTVVCWLCKGYGHGHDTLQ